MAPLYREHGLPLPLEAFVECVWMLRTERRPAGAPPETITPDGCVEVIVQLGERTRAAGGGENFHGQPEAFVLAASRGPLLLDPLGPMDTVGIRFRPGGAAAFLPFPVDRLDGEAPLDLVFGRAGAELPERMAGAPSDAGRVALVVEFLRGQLVERERGRRKGSPSGPAGSRAVAEAVRRLLADRFSVSALAREAGWSVRQLERRFRAETGLPPRLLGRIIRFQRVLRRIADDGADWVSVALECGYADQPHVTRDFREFTGSAPARFLRTERGLGEVFVSSRRLERFFAGASGRFSMSRSFKTSAAERG